MPAIEGKADTECPLLTLSGRFPFPLIFAGPSAKLKLTTNPGGAISHLLRHDDGNRIVVGPSAFAGDSLSAAVAKLHGFHLAKSSIAVAVEPSCSSLYPAETKTAKSPLLDEPFDNGRICLASRFSVGRDQPRERPRKCIFGFTR